MSLKKQLINQGVFSLFIKVLSTLLLFFISIFLTRTLGAEGFGLYSFIISVLMILSIPIQAGIPQLAIRESTKAFTNKEYTKINYLWRWISKRILLAFVLIAILSFLFTTLYFSMENLRIKIFYMGFISILFFSFMLFQSFMIRGLGKNILGLFPDNIIYPVIFFISLIGYSSFISSQISVEETIILYVGSILIAFLFSTFILFQIKPKSGPKYEDYENDKVYWKKSLYILSLVAGLQLLYGHLDIIWVGSLCSDADVGIYKAMLQISSLVVFGLMAINQILYSHFASLYSSNNLQKLTKLVTLSSLVISFLAFIPFIIFILKGEFLIEFIYGNEFVEGYNVLVILMLGQFINALFGSVGALLNMTGHEKDSMKGLFIALLANTILNIILIPSFGTIGAAISATISLLIWNSILRIYVKKRLNIETIGLLRLDILIQEMRR
jgi:O-antigen/teichoic acid export membrane protein